MIGGALQLAMQWPFLVKMGVRLKPNFNFNHPGLRRIGALMLPGLFGAAIYQINIFIGTILASFLPKGSVSFLWYADRIVELPLGVFAIAVGTATLPSFSSQIAKGQVEEWKKTISFSLRLILFISVPATVALIALRVPIISVLFQHGAFTVTSTLLTAEALLYYTLGLWAFSTIRVIVSAFYSLQDTKVPVKAAVVALIVNVVCGVALMYPLKHGGLALATSIASAVNVIMLTVILKRRVGTFLDRDFYRSLTKIAVSSLMMWLSIAVVDLIIPWNNNGPFRERLVYLCVTIACGIVVFFLASRIQKSPELMLLVGTVRRKVKRKLSE
jgi:putative peptidoglycan lipid II flippase